MVNSVCELLKEAHQRYQRKVLVDVGLPLPATVTDNEVKALQSTVTSGVNALGVELQELMSQVLDRLVLEMALQSERCSLQSGNVPEAVDSLS